MERIERVSMDYTEMARKKKVVRNPRCKYRLLVRCTKDGVWQVDIYNGNFIFIESTDSPENSREGAIEHAQKLRRIYNRHSCK